METKVAIRVGEDIRYFISCDTRQKGEQQKFWIDTITYFLSLAKDYEQAKVITEGKFKSIWDSIVPDLMEEQYPKGKCEGRGKALLFQALLYCKLLEVVALSRVKFKERLPEIIWDTIQVALDKDTQLTVKGRKEIEGILAEENIDKELSQAILSEMEK